MAPSVRLGCAVLALGTVYGCDLLSPRITATARITIVGGQDQRGTVGKELPELLRVQIADSNGRGVSGAQVSFGVLSGGGSSHLDQSLTHDGDVIGRWTLGTGAADSQRVEVRAVDPKSGQVFVATFQATAVADGPFDFLKLGGDQQTAVPGTGLTDSLVAGFVDQYHNPVSGVAVSWAAASGTVSPSFTVTDVAEIAKTRWVLAANAGTQQVTAKAGAFSVGFSARAFDAPGYLGAFDLIPLGTTPAGAVPTAWYLNDSGVVAGPVSGQAFRWKSGSFTMLANSGSTPVQVTGMNDRGDVVGVSGGRMVVWNAGDSIATDVLPNSTFKAFSVYGITNNRLVLFSSSNSQLANVDSHVLILVPSGAYAITNNGAFLVVEFGTGYPNFSVWMDATHTAPRCYPTGRSGAASAINDSLDHVYDEELSPATHVHHVFACRALKKEDLSVMVGGATSGGPTPRSMSLGAINNLRWIGGSLDSRPVLVLNGFIVGLDSLTNAAAGANSWSSVHFIAFNGRGSILVSALASGTSVRVLLLLVPRATFVALDPRVP
jgi:hypothetical protein